MRIIGSKELRQKTSLSAVTIWRLELGGLFPSRRQLSAGRVGWIEEEVDKWLAGRKKVRFRNEEKAEEKEPQKGTAEVRGSVISRQSSDCRKKGSS